MTCDKILRFRYLFCSIFAFGCGNFNEHPDRFTLQMISPVVFGPVDLDTGNAALQKQTGYGPDITCSLADPFMAISVGESGCPAWTAYTTFDGNQESSQVVTLAPHLKVLTAPLAPGGTVALRLNARCASFLENPIEIGFPYRASSTGIDRVDLTKDLDGVTEPIEQLVPLPNDQFLAVTHTAVVPILRDASGRWHRNTLFVTAGAGGRARAYAAGKRVVVKSVCDSFGCPYDLDNVYTWEIGIAEVGVNAFSAATEFLGMVGDRLAFYRPDGMAGQIHLWDAKFSEVDVPLAQAAFPADVSVLPGLTTSGGGLTYVGRTIDHFWRVDVDAAGSAATAADLGWFAPEYSMTGRLAPDGASFVYWGQSFDTGDCALVRRDTATGANLWASTTCLDPTVAPVFFQDLVVVVTADKLLALDGSTGAPRWSWDRSMFTAVLSVAAAGDALVVAVRNGQTVVRVIGADGARRLDVPLGPTTLTSNVVATSDGQILGAADRTLVIVHAADAQLHAPPRICTRVDCGAGVTDLAADPANCGRCGTTCPTGYACDNGSCRTTPQL